MLYGVCNLQNNAPVRAIVAGAVLFTDGELMLFGRGAGVQLVDW